VLNDEINVKLNYSKTKKIRKGIFLMRQKTYDLQSTVGNKVINEVAGLKEAFLFFFRNHHFLRIFTFLQKIEMLLQGRVFVVKTIGTRRWKA